MNKWLIIGILAVLLVGKPVRRRVTRRNPDFLKKTPGQRRAAYKLARGFGANVPWASKMKDWRSPKIFRRYGIEVPDLSTRKAMGLVNPNGLFQSFHGVPPKGTRSVNVREPKRLIKLGRLTRINYAPESPSTLTGTEYTHRFGDRGYTFDGKNKPVLAVSQDGRQLVIVNDKSTYKFNSRGIIG